MMSVHSIFWIVCSSLVLSGCATTGDDDKKPWEKQLVPLNRLVIADNFETVPLTATNARKLVSACFPGVEKIDSQVNKIIEDLPKSSSFFQLYGRLDYANVFAVSNHQGFCLQRSESHWPILATEALKATVNPVGPSPVLINDWNRQIVRRLATLGEVRVAYVFPLENRAILVNYWISFSFPRLALHYRHEERKSGHWEKEHFDLLFSNVQLRDVRAVRWGEDQIKTNLIGHRLHAAYQ
jgi:hypothetical protein